MAEVASAYVSLMPSARGFGKQLDSQIGGEVDASGKKAGSRWGSALKTGALTGLAALGVAAAKILGDSVTAASEAQQAVGGVESVFGKYADTVLRDSKKAAQGLGLSATAYNELITVSGAMLKNKGLTDFADRSRDLIKVGADLSAMFGGTTKDAVDALNAAMRGESDPIERYGISLNETAVKAELAAKGQDKLTGAALEQAKTQARLALITKQSADAQGAFGRESDTLAGQQQRLSANWDNLKVTIGTALLPALTDATTKVTDFVSEMQTGEGAGGDFADALKTVGNNMGTITPVLGTLVAGLVAYKVASLAAAAAAAIQAAGTSAATGATWSLNAALRANPIGLVITAITLLAAGLVLAYKKSDTFRSIVDKAFAGVKKAGDLMGKGIGVVLDAMKKGFEAVGKAGTWLWNNALQPAFKFIVSGIASILDLWASMLSTLAKVPGFGWAEKAADAMANAADKARGLADGIKKIPTSKTVNVTVALKYTGLRGNTTRGGDPLDPSNFLPRGAGGRGTPGPQRSFNQVLKEYGAVGESLMERIEKGIKTAKPKAVKAAQDAFDSLRSKIESKRDDMRTTLDGLKDDFAAIKNSVSAAFAGDLFQATTGQGFIDSLMGKKAELTGLLASFNTLKGWGVDPAFLTQLFSSGNGALITELAGMGQAGAVSTASLFGEVTSLGNQLGNAVASNDPVAAEMQTANATLVRIEAALSYLGSDIGKALDGAASKAQRDKKNRGKK